MLHLDSIALGHVNLYQMMWKWHFVVTKIADIETTNFFYPQLFNYTIYLMHEINIINTYYWTGGF